MSDEIKTAGDETEITEADYVMALVLPRINSLMDILSNHILMKCERSLTPGGLPRITGQFEGDEFTFTYLPVGIEEGDRFVLIVSATAYQVPEDDDNAMGMVFECEGFNIGSTFGYAVYDPVDRTVVLRATLPEAGGMPDVEWYEHSFGMFLGSLMDLRDYFADGSNDREE